MARRSYPSPRVRGGDREHQAEMVQEQPRGATPRLRSGAVAKRSYPSSKEQWLCGPRRAERSCSTFKVRRGRGEKVPLVQGKGLCWSSREEIPHVPGKRNPSKMVDIARGHQSADTLKT